MTDITKLLDEQIDQRFKWMREATDFQRVILPHAAGIQSLMRLIPKCHCYLSGETLQIMINITDMKTMEPIIESFQELLGHEFEQTNDVVSGHSAYRTFFMKGLPLALVASVEEPEEGVDPKCRRVQCGEEIVPKYKLECNDDDNPTVS